MSLIRLAIPKGSLQTSTIDLFKDAGWVISTSSRSYFPSIDDKDIECALVRAQEVSRYVESGLFDLALTGKDWILENQCGRPRMRAWQARERCHLIERVGAELRDMMPWLEAKRPPEA